jgi:hypothetical protein
VTAAVLLVLAGAAALSVPATAQTTAPAGALGVPAFSSFDPLDNGDPVEEIYIGMVRGALGAAVTG